MLYLGIKNMKTLGTEYGIQITRPWNAAMYEHNDSVSVIMKEAIFVALNRAYIDDNEDDLDLIAKLLCGYGFAGSVSNDVIYEDACRQLVMIQNWNLHHNVWPDLVKAGLVQDLPVKFVGYQN
jgi:hypothetical protein